MAKQAVQDASDERVRSAEVASYVAALSGDLSTLARRNGLLTLAYLLDIAQLEAKTSSREAKSSPGVKLS